MEDQRGVVPSWGANQACRRGPPLSLGASEQVCGCHCVCVCVQVSEHVCGCHCVCVLLVCVRVRVCVLCVLRDVSVADAQLCAAVCRRVLGGGHFRG